jgi:hypothetical protein
MPCGLSPYVGCMAPARFCSYEMAVHVPSDTRCSSAACDAAGVGVTHGQVTSYLVTDTVTGVTGLVPLVAPPVPFLIVWPRDYQ